MTARIYQRPKNAMQSGKARTDEWVLEFVPSEQRKADRRGTGLCCKKGDRGYLHSHPAEDVEVTGLRRQFPLKSGHTRQHQQFNIDNAPFGTLFLNEDWQVE